MIEVGVGLSYTKAILISSKGVKQMSCSNEYLFVGNNATQNLGKYFYVHIVMPPHKNVEG